MDFETGVNYIKENWREIIPAITTEAKRKVNNETSYICPICGHGKNGDGLTYDPKSLDRKSLHCFGCGFSGSVIDLYMKINNIEFNQALKELSVKAGIDIDNISDQTGKKAAVNDFKKEKDKQPIKQLKPTEKYNYIPPENIDYSEYYIKCFQDLKKTPEAMKYINNRGISEETINTFRIGFDKYADPAFIPGSIDKNEYRPHPTPRVIIPCSKQFYIARSIDPATPKQFKAPNPKGSKTEIFNKKAIYNKNEAIFVCEGIFDALSIIEAGADAISLHSKGNKDILLKELEEHPAPADANFIICFDDDAAKEAEETKQALINHGYTSIIYNIAGNEHDVNDAFIADPEQLILNINNAIIEVNKIKEEEAEKDDLTRLLEKVTTEAYKPIRTGLNFFDNLLGGGIIPQSLLMLIAAPGVGKTTLIQQVAEEMAKNKKPVIYLNFEMSREQMLAKAISAKYYKGNGGLKTMTDILQGYKWSDKEKEKIEKIIDDYRVNNYPYIKYNPEGYTNELNGLLSFLEDIGRKAEVENKPGPAVVIDYIHFIQSEDNLDPAELIKEAVKGLKDYAIKYNTFVIGIIAANREGNKKGQLTMNSGRDSSNLEYTADYQLSLQYEQVDDGSIDPNDEKAMAPLKRAEEKKMIIRVLKNRFFGSGAYSKVIFKSKYNIFDDGNARQY